MVDTKISNELPAVALDGTELTEIVQADNNRKATTQAIANLAMPFGTSGSGRVVLQTGANLITPDIGAASGTSLGLSHDIIARNLPGPVVTLEQFGGATGVGSGPDCTPAWNSAMTALSLAGGGTLLLGNGTYFFNSRPNSVPSLTEIRGTRNLGLSGLMRNYSEASPTAGFITIQDHSGGALLDTAIECVAIKSVAGTTGGSLIQILSVAGSTGNGYHYFRDLYCSYSALSTEYDYCFYVDGHTNVFPGGGGARDITIFGCYFFGGSTGAGIYLKGAIGPRITSTFIQGDVIIDGGGGGFRNSQYVVLNNIQILGTLSFSNCLACSVQGLCNFLVFNSTAQQCRFDGIVMAVGSPVTDTGIGNSYDIPPQTWTPHDASGAGLTLTVNSANYTRSGKTTTVEFNVTYPSTVDTHPVIISGLPAAALPTNASTAFLVTSGGGTTYLGQVFQGTGVMTLASLTTGAAITNNLINNANLWGTFTFIAN